MSDEEIEGEGFTFKDSRSSQLSEDEALDQDAQSETQQPPDSQEQPQQPFKIDFSTFIMSLTSSAFYHLGDIADPETGKTETNLPAVQQTIDMLIMLSEKTKGNLNEEEGKLLEQLIYELQMKFVAKSKQ
ncbi:MAG: DUF1844 domain-containing protein [Nitrospinae bacterium]|nr:DUF1844 domain-containing protein [Nitrospinota bacterium]